MSSKMSIDEMKMASKLATELALVELGEQRQQEKSDAQKAVDRIDDTAKKLADITVDPDIATKRQLCLLVIEYIKLVNTRHSAMTITIDSLKDECEELITEVNDVNSDADKNEILLESRIMLLREKCGSRNNQIQNLRHTIIFTNIVTACWCYFGIYPCITGLWDIITSIVHNIFAVTTIIINVLYHMGLTIYYMPLYLESVFHFIVLLLGEVFNFILSNPYIKSFILFATIISF